jgi:dipeptidyl-peptidase-4
MHARLHPLLLLLLLLALVPAQAQNRLTLEEIHASQKFSGRFFEGGRWAAQGPVITFTETEGEATHLVSYNLETDQRTRLIDGTRLHAADVNRLIEIEGYAASTDGRRWLLYTDSAPVWRANTKGYYYIYEPASGALTPLADRAKGLQMFAKFNPAGDRVAFVRDRNLFVVDLGTMQETQLTTDGAEGTVINGTFDWVYEEEFGLRDGWQWSPDGRYLAFWKLDESQTRDFAMTDLRGQYPEYVRFRYPKAGEANSEVQVGVIDLTTRQTRFFDTDTWNAGGDTHEYIARMGWTPLLEGGHQVWMMRLNRDQNRLDLLYANPATGNVRTVLQEQESTWIDVETDKLTYLHDGRHFVWMSETSGFNHLYLYTNQGQPVQPITSGAWDVTAFHGIDEEGGGVYFTAAKENPMERHLYRLPFRTTPDRRRRRSRAATSTGPVKITQATGMHNLNMSDDLRYFIDSYSSISTPATVTLHRSSGEPVKVLESNDALRQTLAAYRLPAVEFMTVPGADGTPLNAWVAKPTNFDPNRRYPLLLYVYGGPGSQTVTNAWGGSRMLWHLYLAEELGMVVASVDNRGTGARGKAFKSGTYRRLGQLEAEDQVAAAKHFATMPWIDPDRLGIWGWSYGGYMTLMALLYGDGPQTFKVGVAVAPVTDWRLYDTIYTERYMSTPQQNADGYRDTAPLTFADRLSARQKLLLIHGDFDDNVHFQQSVQLANKLQQANKPLDFMMYPGKNHGIFGGKTRLHLFTKATEYLKANL